MADFEINERETLAANESNVDDEDVDVEDKDDDPVAPVRYEITSFGVDFDIEGLYRRLERDEIVIPKFQRSFIWNPRRASRFIESLLLGLPVPGIFLSRDPDSGKYVVIDGQQRLKSIQFFYHGVFNPSLEVKNQRIFRLTGVQKEFEGRTYKELMSKDRIDLDNSVIHATVIKQDAPSDDDTSVYHIFDRINSTGVRLTPQEIRRAVYHGKFIDKLDALNEHPSWRSIFGKVNSRQKDRELILRFLAFFIDEEHYKPPMSEFLTRFVVKNRNPQDDFLDEAADIFTRTMDAFVQALSGNAFRPERALNAAVFDSMTVGLARKIHLSGRPPKPEEIKSIHRDLLNDSDYMEAISSATANEQSVKTRMKKATDRFAAL